MNINARVWKFGDDINTDLIIPARYLNTFDPAELAAHLMEDADPVFPTKVRAGDVIVAGKNFGCGSSREHAPVAIKAAGVACVIAHSFARIFYRNAINIGLPIFESPEAAEAIAEGDQVRVDIESGNITKLSNNQTYQATPFPPFMRELMQAGGLMPYVAERVKHRDA